MEKKALLAITISFAILLLWMFLFPSKPLPPQKPLEGKKEVPQQSLPAEKSEGAVQAPQPARSETIPQEKVQPVKDQEEREILIETSLYLIRFRNRGGVVQSWRLKNYLDNEGKPLELVAPESKIFNIYPLQLKSGNEQRDARIASGLFVISVEEGVLEGEQGKDLKGKIVHLRYADEDGLSVEKKLELPEGEYLSSLGFSVSEKGQRIQSSIIWGTNFGGVTDSANRFYYAGQCVANVAGTLVRVQKKKIPESRTIQGIVNWAGIEDQYFSSLFIPLSPIAHIDVFPSTRAGEGGKEEVYLNVSVPDTEKGYRLFVGPKDYQLLTAMGSDLNQVINFSSISLIAYIAKGLFFSLVWLFKHTIPNYGFGIILITLIIRIIFFPLTQKSFVSMKKMQTQMKKVQPKIDSIKERYRKKKLDYQGRQKMNQEIMELYKKEGINPLGGMSGCLPLLIQLPILWGFYNVLTVAIELRKAPFLLWIKDLSVKDPYYITPLLMGATMLIQQKMSGPAGGDPVQQKMMMFMPLFFTVFFLSFPSGLVLYWLINNILGIGQQYLINKEATRQLGESKK